MRLGLATGYIKPKEERTTSLLNPYTNNDKLTDMSLDERADFMLQRPWCDYKCALTIEDFIKPTSCKNCVVDYLKKEAK